MPGLSATQLIARADRALLHGKQQGGRGEANLFSELPEPESARRFESRFGPAARRRSGAPCLARHAATRRASACASARASSPQPTRSAPGCRP